MSGIFRHTCVKNQTGLGIKNVIQQLGVARPTSLRSLTTMMISLQSVPISSVSLQGFNPVAKAPSCCLVSPACGWLTDFSEIIKAQQMSLSRLVDSDVRTLSAFRQGEGSIRTRVVLRANSPAISRIVFF